jgi:hypothetical protein
MMKEIRIGYLCVCCNEQRNCLISQPLILDAPSNIIKIN